MPIALAAPIADDPLPASAYFSLNTLAPQDEWGLTIRHPFLLASDIPALVQLWVRIDLLDFIAFSFLSCKGSESEGVYLVQSGRESQWISCLTLPCSIWEWRRKESIGFHQVHELSLLLIQPLDLPCLWKSEISRLHPPDLISFIYSNTVKKGSIINLSSSASYCSI